MAAALPAPGTAENAPECAPDPRPRTWRFVQRLARTPGFTLFAIIIFAAIFGPLIARHGPLDMNQAVRLQPPSIEHWFGTDEYGRDLFARIMHGTRIALWVGLISVSLGGTVGTVLGLVAGYLGGAWDAVLTRLLEAIQAFPPVLLAILVTAIAGPSLTHAMIAVAIVSVPDFARVIRGQVLAIKHMEYVEAARSLGSSRPRVVFHHILPNCVPALVVLATFNGALAVMWESSLSFLGLAAQPPQPALGAILGAAKRYIFSAPAYPTVVGASLSFIIIAINRFGDGLRQLLDPRLR